MPQAAHGQFFARHLDGQGELAALSHYMHFPVKGLAQKRYSRCVLELLRNRARFFLWASLAALGLRLLLVLRFPGVVDDSRLYANIAENWLQHGVYGGNQLRRRHADAFAPARLPCVSGGDLRGVRGGELPRGPAGAGALRSGHLFPDRRSGPAPASPSGRRRRHFFWRRCVRFWPTMPLRRSPRRWRFSSRRSHWIWLFVRSGDWRTRLASDAGGCLARLRFPIGAGILLRPDGGILLAAIGGYLMWLFLSSLRPDQTTGASLRRNRFFRWGPGAGGRSLLHCSMDAFATCTPCTGSSRSRRAMRTIPTIRSCTALIAGTRTWIADYVSVQEIYWNVPETTLTLTRLPNRAFDSPQQRANRANCSPTITAIMIWVRNWTHVSRPCRAASSRQSASLLRVAPGGANRRYVAASADRTVSLRSALVGV